METIYLGAVPGTEPCVPRKNNDWEEEEKRQCEIWLRQLERQFPIPQGLGQHCAYKIAVHFHRSGTDCEAAIAYDPHDAAATNFAQAADRNCPEKWDEKALAELTNFTSDRKGVSDACEAA